MKYERWVRGEVRVYERWEAERGWEVGGRGDGWVQYEIQYRQFVLNRAQMENGARHSDGRF